MLGYIFSAVLFLSPALQAVFDLKLQLAFQLAILAGCLSWTIIKYRGPGLPAWLAGRPMLPLAAAAALSFVSLALSPFKGYIACEWGNFACGLLLLACAPHLDDKERELTGRAAAAGAWLVFAVCVLQAFVLRNFETRPPLTNLNALALYCVMMIPFALERRGWALAAAMVGLTVWTQSLGAALAGLTAAGFYAASRGRGAALRENAPAFAVLAVLAVCVLVLLHGDSAAGRVAWWRSAAVMAAQRPLTGLGYASYTWAQALFQPAGAFREHAIYAHNYYLEFIAENGLPAAAAWFAALWLAVRARGGLVKYSVIAALAHSAVDFGLSVPAVFWVFCFLLAAPAQEETCMRPAAAPARAALVLAALLCAALLALDARALAFERHRAAALSAALSGDASGAEAALAAELRSPVFRQPALEFLGRAALTAPRGELRAAAYFEEALLYNPYSALPWRALERIYAAPGREAAAAGLERRRKEALLWV